MTPPTNRPMPTQVFIDLLARMQQSPCERHGDVSQCQPLTGYVTRRVFQVTFEDGVTRRYWVRGGVPIPMEGK